MAATVRAGKTGFARMDPEKHKESARRGGQTAHRLGKAHTFTPEQARETGQKGGYVLSRDGHTWRRLDAKAGRVSGDGARRRGRITTRRHRRAEAPFSCPLRLYVTLRAMRNDFLFPPGHS